MVLPSCAETPATIETLSALRAQELTAAEGWVLGLDQEGNPYAAEMKDTDAVHATVALRRAYDVPYCAEYGPSNPEYRFPFAIEPNQRLVDALDVLKKNSGGYAQWRLLHGRVILTYGERTGANEIFIMDRPLKVDFQARTWREAIVQIESAYNSQYYDVPLVLDVVRPDSNDEVTILREDKSESLHMKSDVSLREVVLSILDEVGDPRVVYGLATTTDVLKRCYHVLRIRYPDVPAEFESADAALRCKDRIRAQTERLERYLDDAQRRRDEAAKAAADAQE